MENKNKKVGDCGENLAVMYFKQKGYKLIERNWRAKHMKFLGEIDLILEKDNELVFVEVKTRQTKAFGYGESAVSYSKKQKIQKAINQFVFQHEKYDEYFKRLDILVVEMFSLVPKFVHFENVELNYINV